MKSVFALGCAAVLAALALGVLVWTLVIMVVWNFLLVPAFHLTPLDWLQAIAIAVVFAVIQSSLSNRSHAG